tara:strand:- start:102 stop:629 length:528 start_codon:yes stop_codon:yes gene_type:complete
MDHLPQRSPEALKRQMEGSRKGRTQLATLREAVNPETQKLFKSMLPTPTVCNDSMYYDRSPNKDRRHSKGLATEVIDQTLPTPTARDWKDGSQESNKNCKKLDSLGRKIHYVLPTPTAMEHKATAKEWDHHSGKMLSSIARRGELSTPTGEDMFLAPSFVEEMMGFEVGHTDLGH